MFHVKADGARSDAVSRRSLGMAAMGAVLAPAVLSFRALPAAAQQSTAYDLIRSSKYTSMFADTIRTHNLEGEFTAPGPFGFFIPLDSAVERLPALIIERFRRDKEYARQSLLNHITNYTEPVCNLSCSTGNMPSEVHAIRTRAGNNFSLEEGTGLPRLGGFPITYANMRASNGYCHTLDGVLLLG